MRFSVGHIALLLSLWICTVLAATRVRISDGILEGSVLKSRNGRDIFAFRGIPYARPPVGVLRFQAPQPPAPWTGVRSAKSDANICLQKEAQNSASRIFGSEDCLYINVYTPKLPDVGWKNSSIPYAVMVWSYGGGWFSGSGSSQLYSPKFLLDHDIVLVTMNYRLGPLGFLSTADDVVPGNYALKDQVQALRWVQRNIAVFGGDPSKVTIAGGSAGAANVHYLVLSPLAKGLFHRGISQSGTAVNTWSYNTPKLARDTARRLARELDCPTETSKRILQCLRTKNASAIAAKPTAWSIFNGAPTMPFRPVKESNHSGAFLTEEPGELMKRGEFSDVPWLSGVNANEGSMYTVGLYSSPHQEDVKRLNDEFVELIPISLEMNPDYPRTTLEAISRKIRQYYFGNKTIDESTRMNVTDMFSDAELKFAGATAVKGHLHASKSPTYFYHFGYRSINHTSLIPYDPDRDYGVTHGDELMYLFPFYQAHFPNKTMGEGDFKMVDVMTLLWTNFVIFGEPTHESTFKSSIEWTPVKTDALETFIIEGPRSLKMSKGIFKNMIDFWSSLPCRVGLSYTNKYLVGC
ncbi:esterase E4-like [Diachasma alloeum]|uniref:esterase E4-like n=1 Tax=Diachasma alloeum TaxID=454923 RepID=UPI0010FAF984|nr:esterase E4-like [Diachasma alloeum]